MYKKYSEILNTYNIDEFPETDIEFCVTEKIHGSHLTFIYDNGTLKLASRTRILPDNGRSFYNADKIYDRYAEEVTQIAKKLDYNHIQFHGELFGGYYRSKSLESRIQKGVEYIPFHDWILFDIYAEGRYLPFFEVEQLVSNIKVVPLLFTGTLKECLEYPNANITRIPELYGLENFADNISEGVVINPYRVNLVDKYANRIIYKNKNDKFKERQRQKSRVKKVDVIDNEVLNKLLSYNNENRLDNLFSKGEVTKDFKDFNKINKLYIEDILKEFSIDNKNTVVTRQVKKSLRKETSNLIRKYLKGAL